MNQYPGFVPMMVPQPYMVAMPTAIPMSGAVPPGLQALPHAQMLHPQVAHMAGAPMMTSAVMTAAGRAAQLQQAMGQLQQGLNQLPQGMGGQLASGMGQYPAGMGQLSQGGQLSLGVSQTLGMGGLPGMPHSQGSAAPGIPTAKVVPQIPVGLRSPDSGKRPYGDLDKGEKSGRFGNRWQSNPEQEVEEPTVEDSLCALDHFNSDLNLVLDRDCLGATVVLDPPGFCFTWSGARATYGICKGKAFYEVHILEYLPTDFGEDHQEMDPNVVRLGWSIDSSSFQLGEEPWSFGYGGTGKFSTNNRFSDYGQRFEAGDVIGAMLDLDSRPGTISFLKNGAWLGVALPLHGFPVGSKDMALYPHVLTKNCRFKVNFGQQDPWFPPPTGFPYIGQLPLADRVRGMKGPERKADCEMIMIVGLPGVGKTTWAINLQKSHPEKRYNIIGTDTLIDKMRVNGLPRKRNYHGRWEVLIDKATKCLNKLFQIASKRKRNFILDQTNVYASARRRKMKTFYGFYRIAAVIQPEDTEMQRRSTKRTVEDGKIVPETAVLEMKANFALPDEHEGLFDRIDYIELPREKTIKLVEQYVREGNEKRPPREEVFKHDNRFHEQQNQQYRPSQNQPAGGQQRGPAGPGQQSKPGMGQGQRSMDSQWYGQGDGLLGRAPDTSEPAIKRIKLEPGMEGRQNQQGGALDLLKQQYDEVEPQESQWGQNTQVLGLKQEGRWPQDASAYTGAGLALQGTPLMSHLTSGGALVVAPPGGISLAAGAIGAQPPPPPPPVMQSQLAHSAAGTAFVAITSLPPPGPPPTMLAVGGLGILGVPPPGFPQAMQPQQQQQQLGSSGRQGGGGDFDNQGDRWQPSPSATANSISSQFSQQGAGTPQGDWNQSRDSDRRQNSWRGDYSSQQQQQQWQEQERDRDVSKGWRGSDSRGNSWQQNKEEADRGQGRYESGGKFGSQADKGGAGSYDKQTRNYGGSGAKDSPNKRFDDFSRPPPGRDDSKTDDYQAADTRDRGFDGRNQSGGADRWTTSRQRDSSSTQERWNSRQDNRSERPDRSGLQDSRESRYSGSGSTGRHDSRAEPRASDDRWSSSGRQEERSRPNTSGRQEDRGRTDDRGPMDRWGSRGQDNSSVRDRDKDRSRERDRSRETDVDRDSYNRGMDRTEREADSSEPRQRRRKSKWDNPDEEGESRVDQDSNYQPQIKQEPGSPTRAYQMSTQGSSYQQGSRQQYFNRPGQPQPDVGLGGNSSFPPKGMNFNKPPPSAGSGPGGPPQGGFTKDRTSELPSLMDMPFGNRSQPQSNQGGHPSSANQSGCPPTSSNQEGRSQLPSNQSNRPPPPDQSGRPPAQHFSSGGRDQSGADGKGGSGETSLLGPVPSGLPAKFSQAVGRGNRADDAMPNISVPPPRDGPPPGFGSGGPGGPGGPIGPGGPGGVGAPGGPGVNRPPFPPGGPRLSNPPPEAGRMGGPGQRPSMRLERPPGPLGPRNPQGFSGPPPGNMGGPPPNSTWNQPRFAGPGGGGRGVPRFEGPGGPPGGGRFPGGPGPMRWPRGPR